jgi:hypothetical protein
VTNSNEEITKFQRDEKFTIGVSNERIPLQWKSVFALSSIEIECCDDDDDDDEKLTSGQVFVVNFTREQEVRRFSSHWWK